jgi:flagellar basal-body rod modification protein FlgD
MSELIAPVVNGVIKQSSSVTEETTKSNELGKDAFLQLLVCQMENQDPLEPQSDTEFVSQLATFSQLEQLQNLTSTYETSQAFSLVGQKVILSTTDSNKNTTYISGSVDFVNVSGSNVRLSVNGSMYDLDQLYSVIDSNYLLEKGLPSLSQDYSLTYDADSPQDITVEVNLGEGDTVATQVALTMNDQVLDDSMYTLSGNKLTISREAFAQLPNGTYSPQVVFNDPYYTTITNGIKITVINSEATAATAVEES